MIFLNLLIGIAVGYCTPKLEPKLKSLAESILLAPIRIKGSQFDMLALLVVMMGAHVVLFLVGAESSVFMMSAGAGLGLFGKPIWAALMARDDR